MASSLIKIVTSSLINAIYEKRVMRTGKGQEGGFLPLLTLSLNMTVLQKGVTRARRGYNKTDHTDKKT